MFGGGMGKMTLYLKSDETVVQEIWSKSGNQSRGWKMDLVANLNSSSPFQVRCKDIFICVVKMTIVNDQTQIKTRSKNKKFR